MIHDTTHNSSPLLSAATRNHDGAPNAESTETQTASQTCANIPCHNSLLHHIGEHASQPLRQLFGREPLFTSASALTPNNNQALQLRDTQRCDKPLRGPRVQTQLTTGSRERGTQAHRYSTLVFGDNKTLRTASNRPGVRFQYPKKYHMTPTTPTRTPSSTQRQASSLPSNLSGSRPATASLKQPNKTIRINEHANQYYPAPTADPASLPQLFLTDAEFEQIRTEIFSPHGQDVYRLGQAPSQFLID